MRCFILSSRFQTKISALILSLFLSASAAYSEELIKDFEEDSIAVLNEELRLKEEKISTIESRVAVSGAKAFCSFNGSGTPAMRGTPYNFSSTITDLGTGLYTLTFTNNLSNDTYCVIGTSDEAGASQNNEVSVVSQSTSQITIRVARGSDNVPQDAAIINVVVFGDI